VRNVWGPCNLNVIGGMCNVFERPTTPIFRAPFACKFRWRPQLDLRFTFERIMNRFTVALRWAHKKQRGLTIRLVSARSSVGGGWWAVICPWGWLTTPLCHSPCPHHRRPLHANGQTLRRHLSCVYKQQRAKK